MDIQHKEVAAWLNKILGHENIPQFEINAVNLQIVHDLMGKYEMHERVMGALIKDFKLKAEEYHLECERIKNVLTKLVILPERLTTEGEASLRALAQSALNLEVSEPSDSCMMLAMGRNTRKKLQLEGHVREESRKVTEYLEKTKQAYHKASALKKRLERLDTQAPQQTSELQKKSKQAVFLGSKAKEYRKQVNALELDLATEVVDSSIHHSNLQKKAEELTQLKEDLKPLKTKLNGYHMLPPDLPLATVKVEEARQELERLEEELTEHINMMVL